MCRLGFIYSTVQAGKSTRAIFLKKRLLKYQVSTLLMAPTVTHGSDIALYDYLIGKDENIFLTIKKQFFKVKLLVIDDAHLLNEVQIDQLLQVVVNLHIAVICFGLRTDFRTSGFSGARRLLELSQVIEEMPTYCSCGRKALFSVRKENGKTTFCGDKILKGQSVSYEALCPECYYRKLIQYKKLKESGRL